MPNNTSLAIPKKMLGPIALTCIIASVCTYLGMFLILPHAVQGLTGSDAVAVANTYIVFVTLIVTLFTALVALVSFYLAQNSTEMKMMKLQSDFLAHLADDNSAFTQNLMIRANSHVDDAFRKLVEGETYHKIVKAIVNSVNDQRESDDKLKESAEKGIAEILKGIGKQSDTK